MIKTILLWLTLIFVASAQDILTAEDAIKIGLKQNFDIQIARNNQQIAENNSGYGTAGFLPTLNATGSYTVRNSEQETNSPFSFGDTDNRSKTGQISLNWTLFDGFKMFIDNSRYRELEKLGEYQSKNLIENSVIGLLRSYYNVVQQKQLLQVYANNLEISRLRMEKEEVRKELGSSSSTDYLNARVSFNNDRTSFLNQELQLQISKKNLNLQLGQNPDQNFDVEDQILIKPTALAYEELIQLALENNKDLLVAKQNTLVAQDNLGLTKSVYYPKLSLFANYGYTNSYTDRLGTIMPDTTRNIGTDIESTNLDKSVGLNLSFNLFNGFRDKISYQNAKLDVRNQEIAYQKSLNNIRGLTFEKYNSLIKQIEVTKLQEENVVAAQQNLQVLQDLYQIGGATSLEFRDAQVNLARTQASLIAAKYQAKLLQLELDQICGTLQFE